MTFEDRGRTRQPAIAPSPGAAPARGFAQRGVITPLAESARVLESAIRRYHEEGDADPDAARSAEPMAEAFAAFVQRLLPAAPGEVHAGIVQLCVLETVKERLEAEASRIHAAGPARVLDFPPRAMRKG